MKVKSLSLAEIPEAAKAYAKQIKGGEIFALFGDLGAGKTTFVRAVCKEIKLKNKITSPTFVIMNTYPVKHRGQHLMIFHLDLYRTKNFKEIAALGLTEFWGKSHTVTFIEWPDKIKKHLPKKTKIVKFN